MQTPAMKRCSSGSARGSIVCTETEQSAEGRGTRLCQGSAALGDGAKADQGSELLTNSCRVSLPLFPCSQWIPCASALGCPRFSADIPNPSLCPAAGLPHLGQVNTNTKSFCCSKVCPSCLPLIDSCLSTPCCIYCPIRGFIGQTWPRNPLWLD